MYALMLESDYVTQKKKTFLDNFWAEFKAVLGKNHVIKSLEKCDFRDIYNHLMTEREAKKQLSKEVFSRDLPGLSALKGHSAVVCIRSFCSKEPSESV